MKQTTIIILFLLLCCCAAAQQCKISGTVTDAQTGAPASFANIALFHPADTSLAGGSTADIDGRFAVAHVCPGNYLVRISLVGYQPWEGRVACTSSLDLGRIELTPGTTLATVSVTAIRPIFTMDGERNIYNTTDDPSIQTGTMADALQNAPGIEVDAEGNVKLRGVQSVDIWINGRACRMNAEALKQYIKTLPASAIKRIEVITNPSARYGGGNPVVNIVTQDKHIENQFLSVGINANSKPEWAPWLSYVFSNDRWDIDAFANTSLLNNSTTTTGTESLLAANGTLSRTDTSRRTLRSRSVSAIASADIACRFDSLSTLYLWGAVMPDWTRSSAEGRTIRHELLYTPGDYTFDESSAQTARKPSMEIEDGIWFEHLFDDSTGHMLMLGYYGSMGWRDSLLQTRRTYTHLPADNLDCRTHERTDERFHCFEASYICPFGQRDTAKGTFANELETGLEGYCVSQHGIRASERIDGGAETPLPWLSHEVRSQSADGSVYANYTRRWGCCSAKAGLRGGLQGGRFSYPDAHEYDYTCFTPTLTPSLHFACTTPGQSTFSLSYTRRMEVPEGNSYSGRRRYTLDGYSVGNPMLQVGSSHRFEAKWDQYRDGLGAVGVSLFYAAKTNQQGELADVVAEESVFHRLVAFSQPVNIGSAWNGGLDLHLTYRPSSFLHVRLNGSLFYDYLDLQFRHADKPYRNGMLCGSVRLNGWVKLWDRVQLFGNIYVSSPTQSLLSTTLWRKGVDVGANADFFHRRLSLSLGVNDLFDWNRWSTLSNNPYLPSGSETAIQSRYVSLGATVRFGQLELEKQERPSRRR